MAGRSWPRRRSQDPVEEAETERGRFGICQDFADDRLDEIAQQDACSRDSTGPVT
jgi:hypothetical protein